MNKISGLILKDLLELKAYKKNFLFSIIIYILLIIMNADKADMVSMGISMIMFLCSIYALATYSYDEKNKTDKYVLTLGVSRKEVIISKYLLVFLSLLLGAIVGILIGVVLYLTNMIKTINLENSISSILGIIYALSLVHSIQIPCIYKYGAEKGRLQIYLIAMIIFLLVGGIYILFPNINLNFLNKIDATVPYIIVLLVVLNYYISYKISYRIYNNKEL